MSAAETEIPDDVEERSSTTSILREGWHEAPELRTGAAFTVVLALIGATGRLVTPVVLQQAIDHGLRAGHVRVGVVVRLCVIGAAVLLVAQNAQRWAVQRLGAASESALFGLRTRTFAHLQSMSLADHAEQRKGALVARVTSDVEQLSQFFAWGGLAWLINTAVVAAVVGLMAVYNWRLCLVAIVVASPVAFLLRRLQLHLVAAYDGVRAAVGDYLGTVSEVISGAATVRAYHLEPATTAQVRRAIEVRRVAANRAAFIAAALFPVGEVFSVLTVAAVVAAGLWLGPASGLTSGSLVAFVFLTGRFLEPVAEFTEVLDQTQTAVAGLRRVLNILDTPLEVAEAPEPVDLPDGAVSIELDDVVFRYRPRLGQRAPQRNALDHVSLAIAPGTSVAVVGSTGSGKSTLAKLLARMADPVAGRVLLDGTDLREVSFVSLRRTVLLVPQEPFLFDTTIGHNVSFSRPDAGAAEVRAALHALGLDDWLADLPDGLDTAVGERGDRLSAGERQLVALARAQLLNPPCLLLDEATSSVDPATEARLARAVAALAHGRTTVTIAHRLSTAMRADRILVIETGRLVEDGSHAQLVAAGGHYAALFADWVRATAGSTSP